MVIRQLLCVSMWDLLLDARDTRVTAVDFLVHSIVHSKCFAAPCSIRLLGASLQHRTKSESPALRWSRVPALQVSREDRGWDVWRKPWLCAYLYSLARPLRIGEVCEGSRKGFGSSAHPTTPLRDAFFCGFCVFGDQRHHLQSGNASTAGNSQVILTQQSVHPALSYLSSLNRERERK